MSDDTRLLKAEAALADLLANPAYALWPEDIKVLADALAVLRKAVK